MTAPWIVVLCLLSTCVLLTALVVLGALRRISAVLEQAEARLRDLPAAASAGPGGLVLGATLPAFEADRLGGGDPLTDAELRGSPATILFLSASCPPCATLARDLRRHPNRGESVYVVVSEANDAKELRLTEAQPVLIQRNGQLSEAFKATATPHAFVFNSAGILVAAGTPNSGAALRRLAAPALEEGGDAAGQEAMETISI
jgi:glutaredoxin-related protein